MSKKRRRPSFAAKRREEIRDAYSDMVADGLTAHWRSGPLSELLPFMSAERQAEALAQAAAYSYLPDAVWQILVNDSTGLEMHFGCLGFGLTQSQKDAFRSSEACEEIGDLGSGSHAAVVLDIRQTEENDIGLSSEHISPSPPGADMAMWNRDNHV